MTSPPSTLVPVEVPEAAGSSWKHYATTDWLFLGLSLSILVCYTVFYLLLFHFFSRRSTLYRNMVQRRYVKELGCSLGRTPPFLAHTDPLSSTLSPFWFSRSWVVEMMQRKGAEILLIQATRNGILTSSFFSVTCTTLAVFLLGYVLNTILSCA